VVVVRGITEHPVAGGEKWSASFGPSARARVALRALRASASAAAALGVAMLAGGTGALAAFLAAAALLAATIAAEWIAGGSETVIAQGEVIAHRRRRLFRERRRTVALLDVRRVRPPAGRGRRSDVAGLRIETADDVWAVGQGIAWAEANELAGSLARHLRLFEGDVLAVKVPRLASSRSAAAPGPVPAQPEAVLRLRNPPPR
jgi:hypothetical protein